MSGHARGRGGPDALASLSFGWGSRGARHPPAHSWLNGASGAVGNSTTNGLLTY